MSDESKRVYNYQLAQQFAENCKQTTKALADVQTELSLIRQTVERMDEAVEGHTRALRGSNGREGLLTRFAKVEAAVEATTQMNTVSLQKWNDLFVVVMGDKDTQGIREDVHSLIKWKKSLNYWYVLLITATLTGVVNILLRLISIDIP